MTQYSTIRAFKNLGFGASLLAASVCVGAIAPAAQATSLVPQQEGEVNVGFSSCLGTGCSYLTLNPAIDSIMSLTDSSTGTKSRLFVDKAGTKNQYGGVTFLSKDIGTSDGSGSFWFRPVAMQNETTPLIEKGQLEVGTFKFTFAKVLSDLTVNWFDTERKGGTTYIAFGADGTEIASGKIAAGPNNNLQATNLTNVKSIILNLGEKDSNKNRTGDGVNFQVDGTVAVPEPGSMLGLGAVALAGGLGLRKRQDSDITA